MMKNNLIFKKTLTCFLLAISSFSVAQAASLADLDAFLTSNQGATASFTELVTTPSKDGKTTSKTASGTFSYLRPNLFKFNYQKPFEQQIISDGKYLWLYDLDLEQVTKQSLQQLALPESPLNAIMDANSLKKLQQTFKVSINNEQLIELIPIKADQQINKLKLDIVAQKINKLEIFNSFGQHSVLNFNYQKNIPKATDFKFQVPQDVELIDQSKAATAN